MNVELQLGTLITAGITYLSAVGVVYAGGRTAAKVLSERTIHTTPEFSKNGPTAATMRVILDVTLGSVDRWLGFQKDGFFYRPTLGRSVAFSLVVVALSLYPLRNTPAFVYFLYGITINQLLSHLSVLTAKEVPYVLLSFGILLVFNAIADFVSFAKTRTLLASFGRLPSPIRALPLLFLDAVFSVLIAYAVATYPWLLYIFIVMLHDLRSAPSMVPIVILIAAAASFFIIRRRRPIDILVGYMALLPSLYLLINLPSVRSLNEIIGVLFAPMVLTFGVFMSAAATGLGITIISALIAVIGTLAWAASRLQANGIWKIPNFDKKPMESAATIVIVVFTLIYWPIVLI